MISQTVEYALRAMSNLASLQGAATTSEAIAQATRVPQGYLSKIMRDLVCAELVKSFRGPRGGFVLARDANSITVLDIVNAVDPIRRITRCPLDDPRHANLCPLHRCLDDALAHLEQIFRSTTLGGMALTVGGAGDCRTLFTPSVSAPPAKERP
jgi:Rrf2 family protein